MGNSETAKYRHLTAQYCQGSGVDIGSSGDPVVPHAIQIDLEKPYCPLIGDGPIHLRGDGTVLKWFAAESLDFVYSSHLIEDFYPAQWKAIFPEWSRVLKKGGYMVILAPEKERWRKAIEAGQPPNEAHCHEPQSAELSYCFGLWYQSLGLYDIIMDECPDPNDYGIVFVARKRG